MIIIHLTNNPFSVYIDDADYTEVNKYKWRFGDGGYAITGQRKNHTHMAMHHLIIGRPDDLEVDHIDKDKLNNQRHNLRFVTHAQNATNRSMISTNTTGYKGVSFHAQSGKYQVKIHLNGKSTFLGLFANIHEAAIAYNKASLEQHGVFGYQNVIIKP